MENLKSGTDAGNLANSTGGVTNASGQVIISSDSDGGSAYMFGPGFSRAVYGYVANGSFGDAPQDPASIISANDNPLPYFDLESSGTGITVQAIADATAASGNVLRFSIPAGTAVGTYLYIKRKIAVLGSAARSYTYQPRSAWRGASASTTQVQARIVAQYYQSDNATASGTAFTNTATLTTIAGAAYAYEIQANPNVTGAVPSNAAFLEVKTGVYVATLTTAAYTVDLTEVRVDSGPIQLVITDQAQPDNYGYGVIYLLNGTMWIRANETGTSGTNPTIYLSASTGNIIIDPTSTGTAQVLGSASVTGNLGTSGDHNLTGDLNIGVSDTSVAGAIVFKGGNGGSIRAFSTGAGNDSIAIKTTDGSAYTAVVALGFYPGGSGTYNLTHNGTNFTMNDTVAITGGLTTTTTITATGALTGADLKANGVIYNDQPTTSTLTTNGARFTLISGSNFRLDRITSSGRFKTDIVDAGTEVLEASRRVNARHYTSTIEHEQGGTRLGFIAEELMEAGLDHAVGLDEEGRPDTLDPVALIAALWTRVADLEARIEALEAK
jgi:hypothetical protein